MNIQIRHIDKGRWLRQYSYQAVVCCIKCDAISQIYYKYQDKTYGSKVQCTAFHCPNCQLSLVNSLSRKDWVGHYRLVGNQPCDKCGIRLSTKNITAASYKQQLPSKSTITCSHCTRTNEVILDQYRIDDPSLAVDSDFGLPLFLQTPCRFGKIWAYNQAHLSELQAYINATLRERTREAGNSSMISSLPDWMKSAKNRAMISKKLAQLQIELTKYQNTLIIK